MSRTEVSNDNLLSTKSCGFNRSSFIERVIRGRPRSFPSSQKYEGAGLKTPTPRDLLEARKTSHCLGVNAHLICVSDPAKQSEGKALYAELPK